MKVLVVDDAPDVAEVVGLCFELRWPGTTLVRAADGEAGLAALEREGADLVILDVGLPGMDGYEVCRQIRASSPVPIIMLTVRDEDTDIVRGLEAGADDYVTKPFSHIQLLARANAVLRRTQASPLGESPAPFTSGDFRMDFATRQVRVGPRNVKLTPIEFHLLSLLVKNAGRIVPYRALLTNVWGPEHSEATDYLKVHIQHLRRKLGDDLPYPKLIVTERKAGYRFVPPVA